MGSCRSSAASSISNGIMSIPALMMKVEDGQRERDVHEH